MAEPMTLRDRASLVERAEKLLKQVDNANLFGLTALAPELAQWVRDAAAALAPRTGQEEGLLEVVKEYLAWGAMTGSDRDYFDGKFRAAVERAALAGPSWQPIETANKAERILGGAYHKVYGWLWDKASYHRYPALKKEEWTMENGMTPTHWMPLPDPPTEAP